MANWSDPDQLTFVSCLVYVSSISGHIVRHSQLTGQDNLHHGRDGGVDSTPTSTVESQKHSLVTPQLSQPRDVVTPPGNAGYHKRRLSVFISPAFFPADYSRLGRVPPPKASKGKLWDCLRTFSLLYAQCPSRLTNQQ